jgi:hypothetical protein
MVEAGRAKGLIATSHFFVHDGGSSEGPFRVDEWV